MKSRRTLVEEIGTSEAEPIWTEFDSAICMEASPSNLADNVDTSRAIIAARGDLLAEQARRIQSR